MSDPETTPSPPAAIPEYRAAQRWNIVWVVPILALLIGGWMIYLNLSARGPVAQVIFETADGLAAKKTEVKCRSVRVGVVKEVKLAGDLKSVLINVELDPDYEGLLRKGTQFWVVRPRVSTTDVSGLGTLITGAFVELDPGPPDADRSSNFIGLEKPPATNRNIPGRRLILSAEEAGSLVEGSPIYYRGFEVGRIESRTFDIEYQRVTYDAFITQKYSGLVTENTRFWNTSGIDISAGPDGVKLRTPSFQAMFSGGATFDVPDGIPPGEAVADGKVFTLFEDEDAAKGSNFNPTLKFVLLFEQTVRGLSKHAPVEFRGIPIGRVADISFDYLKAAEDPRVGVLVEIDPSLLRPDAAEKIIKPDGEFLKEAVGRGLRASLKIGSLLTGSLYVDLDYYKEVTFAEMGKVGELPSLPTISGGLDQLQTTVADTLKKIGKTADEFAITAADGRKSMVEINDTLIAARKVIESADVANISADLRASLAAFDKLSATFDKSLTSYGPEGPIQGDMLRTLEELRASLRTMKSLMNTVNEKPNSLLFGRDSSGNPIPPAPKGKR
ncbi:MAG: MlaD family protein [Verrucomicrobiota bacterium]